MTANVIPLQRRDGSSPSVQPAFNLEPADREPVLTILEAYRVETGDMAEPKSMGGGTYARAVPNTVSVGTGWEGDGPAHENDERIHISHPLKMAKIYVHILYRLAHLAGK